MDKEIKKAVEKYQCSGCISGSDTTCFIKNSNQGVGCGKHYPGTMIMGIGDIFLGMPKGFNRLGHQKELKPVIYPSYELSEGDYNVWNVPCWKHLTSEGHTLVRGLMPRRNEPFLHIYLEDCMDKINCLAISQEQINAMD